MKWEDGRLKSGYLKKVLAMTSFCDLVIIKFPEGCRVPPHYDKLPGKAHYRINLHWRPKLGGYFKVGSPIFRFGPITFFRPDLTIHSMTEVLEGTGYMLSFGWCTNEDTPSKQQVKLTNNFAY